MAGKGPAPKPAFLRQRTNRKPGATTLEATTTAVVPVLPNPDGRKWHALTLQSWAHAWTSPMAGQWLEADVDALGRLAILWDGFYQSPDAKVLAEIRLQECRFGLSPLDRSRLQWEVTRAEEKTASQAAQPTKPQTRDPRSFLVAVK